MKRIAITILGVAGLMALQSTAQACPLAYAVNFSGQFGIIDLATGVFTAVGDGFENIPDGIMGAPGGPLYTVDGATGHLLKIGLDGKSTDVGDTHTGPQVGPSGISIVGSLTDGSLYAIDFSNNLLRINRDTGAVTRIAALSTLPPQEADYSGNMVTSFAGDADRLYFTIEISDGPNQTGPTLYVINPAPLPSGQVTVSSKPLKLPSRAIGSGVVNGSLYLFGDGGDIVKVNPATGEAKAVSTYDAGGSDDGPPLTGIFGVVGTAEPAGMRDPEEHANRRVARDRWPVRYMPRRGVR